MDPFGEFINFTVSLFRIVFGALAYLAARPKVAAALIATTCLLVLAPHVHGFWWLPLGIGLVLWGARLRAAGR